MSPSALVQISMEYARLCRCALHIPLLSLTTMYLFIFLCIPLFLPSVFSLALFPWLNRDDSVTTSRSTSTELTCKTLQGLLPVAFVPTQTLALIDLNLLPVHVTATSTPTIFATPAPVTLINNITSTIVSTVLVSVESDIFSSTLTVQSTVLDFVTPAVVTSFTTYTRSQTTFTSTASIDAPAAFQGVLQTGIPAGRRLRGREAHSEDHVFQTAVSENDLSARSIFNAFQSQLQSLVAVLSGRTRLFPIFVNCMTHSRPLYLIKSES